MKNIVLITSDEVRHKYFRRILAKNKNINLKLCIVESTDKKPSRVIYKDPKSSILMKNYYLYRDYIENDFFSEFVSYTNDTKNILKCNRGEFNSNLKILEKIENSKPDLIISYGCALVKENLINKYKNKFINIHLGISPYYNGVGSNFWAYIEKKPELIGSTIMMIDPGIDSGDIIHQIRPKIYHRDNFHIISARLIKDTVYALIKIINIYKKLKKIKQWKYKNKTYYRKDFTEKTITKFDKINHQKMIAKYLKNKKKRDKKYKLIEAF